MKTDIASAVIASLFLEFVNDASMIILGQSFLIRFFCQINLTFMEEQIGEFVLSVSHLGLTVITTVIICGALLLSGDILTTNQYNLLTHSTNSLGECF